MASKGEQAPVNLAAPLFEYWSALTRELSNSVSKQRVEALLDGEVRHVLATSVDREWRRIEGAHFTPQELAIALASAAVTEIRISRRVIERNSA